MNSEQRMRLGMELSGSKIELVAFVVASRGRLRRCVSTSRNEYRATLATVRDLVVQSEHELGAGGSIGIGTPGSLSRASGRLRNSNSVCLRGTPGVHWRT